MFVVIGEAMIAHRIVRAAALAAPLAALPALPWAHEAWLLPVGEFERLAGQPAPVLFADPLAMGSALSAAGLVAALALGVERRTAAAEARLAEAMAARAGSLGLFILRALTAAQLALAALGAAPRHGVEPWRSATLIAPDMTLPPEWGMLAAAQIALSVLLTLGLLTRAAGLGLGLLTLGGFAIHGVGFLAYAPHVAAPALLLAVWGAGPLSLDRALGLDADAAPTAKAVALAAAQALTGLGFVYLAAAYKLSSPQLVMEILRHGEAPLFGLPLDAAALLMALVELTAGALLAAGRLARPVSLLLIGAFTFFAVALGESPLLHANLYGLAAFFMMTGGRPIADAAGGPAHHRMRQAPVSA